MNWTEGAKRILNGIEGKEARERIEARAEVICFIDDGSERVGGSCVGRAITEVNEELAYEEELKESYRKKGVIC